MGASSMTTLTFPLKVDLKHVGLSDAQFYQLCITNPDLNVGRAAKGVLIFMDNGVKFGWVFNPQEQQVEIYRQGKAKEVRSLPTQLSGEAVLPGFNLQMDQFTDD
jgi:Putative restriction endonuclease